MTSPALDASLVLLTLHQRTTNTSQERNTSHIFSIFCINCYTELDNWFKVTEIMKSNVLQTLQGFIFNLTREQFNKPNTTNRIIQCVHVFNTPMVRHRME